MDQHKHKFKIIDRDYRRYNGETTYLVYQCSECQVPTLFIESDWLWVGKVGNNLRALLSKTYTIRSNNA